MSFFWFWNSLVVAAGRRRLRGAAANHARASAARSRRLGERRLLGRLGVQLAVEEGGGEVVRLGRLELQKRTKEVKNRNKHMGLVMVQSTRIEMKT